MWQYINQLWSDITNTLFNGGPNLYLGDGDSLTDILEDMFARPEAMFYWLGVFATTIILVVLAFALFKWAFTFVFKCFKLD